LGVITVLDRATWDADYSEGKDQPRTVIRNGDTVLFSEPASWEAVGFPGEGSSRYEGICKVLKQKYGNRESVIQICAFTLRPILEYGSVRALAGDVIADQWERTGRMLKALADEETNRAMLALRIR
jgi:hypothetical protein